MTREKFVKNVRFMVEQVLVFQLALVEDLLPQLWS